MPPHFLDGEPHAHTERPRRHREPGEPMRIGGGGPVGSGKTALVAALCRQLRGDLSLAVLTNDIYTTEDADFLRRHAVLPDERIAAVQTGGCPHTAIRDDITANLDAIDDPIARNDGLDLILVESGGDNLTATFSSGLVDVQIFVVDVAGGQGAAQERARSHLFGSVGNEQDRPRSAGGCRPRGHAPRRGAPNLTRRIWFRRRPPRSAATPSISAWWWNRAPDSGYAPRR